jgi:uncharacterized CHY-type Zn-finger protein
LNLKRLAWFRKHLTGFTKMRFWRCIASRTAGARTIGPSPLFTLRALQASYFYDTWQCHHRLVRRLSGSANTLGYSHQKEVLALYCLSLGFYDTWQCHHRLVRRLSGSANTLRYSHQKEVHEPRSDWQSCKTLLWLRRMFSSGSEDRLLFEE